MAGRVAIVLPQRERYTEGSAGAIALQVGRLAAPDDLVVGSSPGGAPLRAGRFVPVRAGGLGLTPAARYARAVARALHALPDPPRLIEVHNRPEIAQRLARSTRRLLRRTDGRLVLVLHNDPQAMRRARTAHQRQRLLDRMAVICVSEWVRQRFIAGLDPDTAARVTVLHNALDLSVLPPSPPASARDPVFLFVGRTVADKGADVFVAACAKTLASLPGWRAAMLGADGFGPDAPETPFMSQLRAAAAAAGVEMLGYRPHAETLAIMSCAGVVVAPSRWPEPFGLTALEALACGAPLIATATGGMAEIVGDGEAAGALLAEPGDPVTLAACMRRLAGDAGLRERLRQAGLQRARRFDAVEARRVLARFRDTLYASRHREPCPTD